MPQSLDGSIFEEVIFEFSTLDSTSVLGYTDADVSVKWLSIFSTPSSRFIHFNMIFFAPLQASCSARLGRRPSRRSWSRSSWRRARRPSRTSPRPSPPSPRATARSRRPPAFYSFNAAVSRRTLEKLKNIPFAKAAFAPFQFS